MSAQVWFIIGIVGFSLAGALFIAAVLIFIRLNIFAVIGDLSGRTATKQIEKFRQSNASSGVKSHRPDVLNVERGKLTEPVADSQSGQLRKASAVAAAHPSKRLGRRTGQTMSMSGSGVLGTDVLTGGTDVLDEGTAVLSQSDVTEALSDSTTVLEDEENNNTTILSEPKASNATTVLSEEPSSSTTVLSPTSELSQDETVSTNPAFKLLKDIVVIHTDEVIG
jgi:hypothetical protein